MNEHEGTPDVQQHEHEPHLDPQLSFVEWCLQMIGASEEAVKDRLDVPWIVLFVLGPQQCVALIAQV
jgi:hypothetical protein